ncbi:MAG: multiple sugar transport system substrate-binding protein [Actinomycetota bacterium]|nr:multiple sugar transport system substrate-binding protein [Actinomycetota bacterium]
MKRNALVASIAAIALAGLLAACSGGGSGTDAKGTSPKLTSCSNKYVYPKAPQVSVWGWYPNMKLVVDNFNKLHKDVQICWNNVGQGGDEYTKVQTAISAKKGLPDVVMLEADHLATYEIQGALVDISKYGANKVKGNFSEGAWNDVSGAGGAVYAAPVDGGPLAMIYRTDVFKKYGITTPPTTWDEYAADAKKVKDAGGPLFGDFGANVPALTMALQIQKGANPFTYDAAKKTIKINLNDQPSKDVLDYWAGLVKDKLVGTADQFTTDYISGVVSGKYATYVSAAWAPGYLTGAGVGKGSSSGVWAVAPLPQWDASSPVQTNWGGSAFAVTSQATDKKLAAEVALGIYADPASLKDGWTNQVIFPLNQSILKSSAFLDNKSAFFSGQTANKDVYVPAENAYKGINYSPLTVYFYAQLQAQSALINQGKITGSQAADAVQASLEKYAQSQGFTVQK